MTKYEKLYGVSVSHFLNEEANVKEKLRLANIQMTKLMVKMAGEKYDYERECEVHELNQAIVWCRKILENIDG